MPHKGYFTAAACVLFDRPVPVEALADALAAFQVVRQTPGADSWELGGPGVVLPYRPEVNGYVLADTNPRSWPDDMGDPKAAPMLFAAWSMGHFGPFAFPGGLARAAQQSWGWPDGKAVPDRHTAFVRLLTSYALGAKSEDPIFPDDYDPLGELHFLTRVAGAVLGLPGAVCYFNPNGETLRTAQTTTERLHEATSTGQPPLDLWVNIRLFNVDAGWSLMDTVGHSQFDHLKLPKPFPDLEAAVPPGDRYDLGEIDHHFRNLTLYLLEKGPVIADGDTIDGPGGVRWRARARKSGLINPPRATLRFFPEDRSKPPPVLVEANEHPLGG
jgi:hypothetical protein